MRHFELKEFLDKTDSMNNREFAEQFSSDACWYFANHPAIQGREQIANMAQQFYQQLDSIEHKLLDSCQKGSKYFFEGKVVYGLKNSNTIELPFSCSMTVTDGLIREYRTYLDLAPFHALR